MGGGVMRAAAKVAGVGVVAGGGLRGISVPAEQQVFSASRKSYAPISSAVLSADGSSVAESYQRPSWELEEWEFAGVEEDSSVGELLPRVVFGGAPTKEEAEVATLELKDAIEKVYLGSSDSAVVDGMSLLSHCGHSVSSVTGGHASRSVAKPALQAFKFLSSSPEAQKVVVSVVSDQNVWGAVFKNEAFVEYLESQKGSIAISNEEPEDDQSVVDSGHPSNGDVKCSENSESQQTTDNGSFFTGFIDSVKISVIDLANSVSGFFQNIFRGGESEKKSSDAGDPVMDMTTVGSYIMGLAVMVITVVVLKRV
uniref:Uncharacterized protein n=1 Tax=Kalanchoe fedtschenkoi TaxID=63787 RepID=A0A7N0SW29_KALFE